MKTAEFLEKKEKEIITFLQRLVQTPSQNGIDPEKNIANFVVRKLKKFGLKPKLVGDKERPSVMCVLGRSKSRRLLLNAHLDTVPAGDSSLWKHPPFSAKIVGQRMYGRGAADCKAAIAIFSYLVGALAKTQTKLNGQLILGFDADEESGNFTGFKNIIREIGRVDGAIVGYPGIDEIVIGSRGFLRLRMTTFGKPAHTGSRTQKGVNAILKMNKIISVVSDLKLSHKRDSFFWFGPKITVSQISGGRAINIVPDECFINVDIRLVPGQAKEQILGEIKDVLKNLAKRDPELKFQISILQYQPAFKTNPEQPIIKILRRNAERILSKKTPLVASGASGAQNLLGKEKISTISGFGVEFGNVHGINEWVNFETILPIARIYLKTVIDFL